jgi:hypothetical protein
VRIGKTPVSVCEIKQGEPETLQAPVGGQAVQKVVSTIHTPLRTERGSKLRERISEFKYKTYFGR